MKKGNNSSNIWALRQIADFMASTSHAVFPTSSMSTWGAGELPGAEVEEVRWGREGWLPGYGVSGAAELADLEEQPKRYLALLLRLLALKTHRGIIPGAQK